MQRATTVLGVDPAITVTSVAQGVTKTQSFTPPTPDERTNAGRGLARLAIGDIAGAAPELGPIGFTVTDDTDPATGRRYALAVSETDTPRAWGVYLVDLSEPLRLCVAVPHPKSDAICEQLALRLWRAVPGSMLAMAAVHRRASSETADHAHNTATVFHHLWTGVLGPRGVPQIQIHGFDDDRAPERIVVSTGAGPVTPAAVRIADEIAAIEPSTTRSWDDTADRDLRARTNVQGIAADTNGWIWVHIEHNRTVRDTPALWEPAVDAVAAANPSLLAYDRPSPGGPDHFPKPVGASNTSGTSRYFAREDHRHRGATDVHTHPEPAVRFAPVDLLDQPAITARVPRRLLPGPPQREPRPGSSDRRYGRAAGLRRGTGRGRGSGPDPRRIDHAVRRYRRHGDDRCRQTVVRRAGPRQRSRLGDHPLGHPGLIRRDPIPQSVTGSAWRWVTFHAPASRR
jgi:hypothetical protein